MRHSIGSERPVLDPSGNVMPVRGKMNFIGSRVSASESGGTTTVNVESVGSTEHIVQRFINNAGSLASPNTFAGFNLGAVDGAWAPFIDDVASDLAQGYIVFAETGLYHLRIEVYLSSGVSWPTQTTWPRFEVDVNNSGIGYGTWSLFGFKYHYPAVSPYAYAHHTDTVFMEAGDYFYIDTHTPDVWATRSYTSKVLINRVA